MIRRVARKRLLKGVPVVCKTRSDASGECPALQTGQDRSCSGEGVVALPAIPTSIFPSPGLHCTAQPISQPTRMRRDLRFDFFRGIALLGILWVHILVGYGKEIPPYFRISPYHIGLSGSAEIFVFISGYVFALVYARVLDRTGFGWTYAKAINRAWQLYVANAFTLLISFGVVWLVGSYAGEEGFETWHMSPDMAFSPERIWMLLSFREVPDLFDILKLYIFILIFAPALLHLIRKNWPAALVVTLVLYAGAQVQTPLPEFIWQRGEGLNTMGWQVLFAVGMILAIKQPIIPRNRALMWLAVALWVVSFFRAWFPPSLAYYGVIPAKSGLLRPFPYTDHELLGPVRLAHFLVTLYLVSGIVGSNEWYASNRMVQPIIVVGQNALEVFCFGLVETYTACGLLTIWQPNHLVVLLFLLVSLGLTIAFAYMLRIRKSEPWRRAE